MMSLPAAPWFTDPSAAPPAWHYPFHLLDVGQATLVRGPEMASAERAAREYSAWLCGHHGITDAIEITVTIGRHGSVVIRRTA